MTEQQYGQKRVRATEVRPYDRIFRTANDGSERMMLVHDFSFVSRQGENPGTFLTFNGPTYRLNPSKVGEQMSGTELGEDSWTIPNTGMVLKVVPIEEAEFG